MMTTATSGSVTERLTDWLNDPLESRFPYDQVIGEFHRRGKHFVPGDVLSGLAQARSDLGRVAGSTARVELLRRFLDTALDKFDELYDYPSYTALQMLPMPAVDDPPQVAQIALPLRDRLTVQLMADTLGFEVSALHGEHEMFPQLRPDRTTVVKRCRLGMRVARPALDRIGLAEVAIDADPVVQAVDLNSTMCHRNDPFERDTLRLSVLPVHVEHDEYFFIRVLQLFETSFATLAVYIRGAIDALTGGEAYVAVAKLDIAQSVLRESAPLFSMLATMQVDAFLAFREFTDGASAIQSRNYKLVEALCRRPEEERLHSAAFLSVPDVRDRVLLGQMTVDAAYETAMAAGDGAAEHAGLPTAMRGFSSALMRWRQTHYRLAVRMLGQRTGTGYTEGTPYLDATRSIPVFTAVEQDVVSDDR